MKIDLHSFYKKFYNLKTFEYTISNQKIMFLIYDDKYYYYLDKDKFINYNKSDSMICIIKELSKNYKINIINYYPVCFCNKTLVLALRVNNVETSCLNRASIADIPEKYKKLVRYHRLNFDTPYLSMYVNNEIKASLKYIHRYRFHENFIKKYILTEKKRKKNEFKELIYNYLPEKESIIDVSCGDSTDLFEVAKKRNYKTIVGNDICINYLDRRVQDGVIYTNDDNVYNNIKSNSYDVVYCKNTLHHMNNEKNIKSLLNFLDNISKTEILIIEIVNPKEYGGLPKFLNKWLYSKFLKDLGKKYLNEKQFKQIVNSSYKGYDIKFDSFTNILGKYMVARVSKGR